MLKHINNRDEFKESIKEGTVLVDFFATWCGPCKMLSPVLEEVSKESNIDIIKVDVDEFGDLARRYGIMNIPTLLLYRDGDLVNKKLGYLPVSALKEFLHQF